MAIFVHKCPHCSADKIALQIVSVTPYDGNKEVIHTTCPSCRLASSALMMRVGSAYTLAQFASKSDGDPSDNGFIMLSMWPAPPTPLIPDHLPPPVERALLQAERNFGIAGNEEAAAMMYRRALEVGLHSAFPDVTGMLAQTIKKLSQQHAFPPALAEWADQVRSIGNEAAHEEAGVTTDDVKAIRAFTDTMLRYVFTLPAQIAERRAAREVPG